MPRVSASLRALVLLGALPLLAGCSSDSRVLARVGSRAIGTEDFLAAARGNDQLYAGDPDSVKKAKLLDDLIRRELLVLAAVQTGLHRDTLFLDFHRRLENQVLRERLYQQLVPNPIPVSDSEVAELYRWRAQEARVRLIFTLTRGAADAALAETRRGEPFAQVATRFNPPGFVPPGGDLGFVPPGGLVGPLDPWLRNAPIGRVNGPVRSPRQGWFLMVVEERRARAQPPLESQRTELTELLRQRKRRAALMREIDRLSAEYAVHVRPGASQLLIERLRPPLAPPEAGAPLFVLPTLDDAERGQVLVDYRGGSYTLGDAVEDFREQDSRPNLQVEPMVERWIENHAFDRAVIQEARRRHLNEEPDVERTVRTRAENYLLEGYYNREVMRRIEASPEDVRALHARLAPRFMRLDEVRLLTVTLPDSGAAAQLAAHSMHGGGTLREVVAMAAPGARVREEKVSYPSSDPYWREFQGRFMAMSAGEYAGPQASPAGWMLLQMVSKVQRPQRFEELSPVVLQHLQNQVLEEKREARLQALTDSLRRMIPVEIHSRRLARVMWPGPAMPRA